MALTILVLHGPNLHLQSDEIDASLEERANELGVDLSIVQANSEGVLIDEVHEQGEEYDAIIVNPGALAPIAFALAEAIKMVEKPAIEVLLSEVPKERGSSALTSIVRRQIHGQGIEGYLLALTELVPAPAEASAGEAEEEEEKPLVAPKGKSIGRKRAPEPEPVEEPSSRGGKTIGRKSGKGGSKPVGTKSAPTGLTRAMVRTRIADRLAKKTTPDELATWARAEWAGLQRGAPCEPGAKDVLEGVLLTLMAGVKASDHILLAQMAKLG